MENLEFEGSVLFYPYYKVDCFRLDHPNGLTSRKYVVYMGTDWHTTNEKFSEVASFWDPLHAIEYLYRRINGRL